MTCNEESLFVLVPAILFGILPIYGYYKEKKAWNKGISPYTLEKWTRFDTDSQGGRGYMDSHFNIIWISYPGIDKRNDV